jgi:hypothetical protein
MTLRCFHAIGNASNPYFRLDFSIVAHVYAEIMAARNSGAAVHLVDELSDSPIESFVIFLGLAGARIACRLKWTSLKSAIVVGH